MLFIHETFLVYKLETFKNFKEVEHFMIMAIATIYIFFYLTWYLIKSWKWLSENPQPAPPQPEKINHPLFTHSLLKKIKSASPRLFVKIEKFSASPPPPRKGGRALCLFEIPLIKRSRIVLHSPPYEANNLNLPKQVFTKVCLFSLF